MRMRKSLFLAAAAAVAMASGSVSAQTGASFARKTITIYIANTAGGSYDLYARLIARNFGKHLPGTPTVVASNMPGGGGLICANYLYTVAPKDGTALGVLIETVAVEQALKDPGVRYDAAKFNWVGRVASSNNVHFQWHSSKVQSLEDAKKMETTVAGTGPGNMAEIMPKVLNAVVGTKFKIISGYPASTEAMLAMEKGEVEGGLSAWATLKVQKQDWLRDKTIKIILQDVPDRSPELADVPALGEIGSTQEEKGVLGIYASNGVIGRSLVAPPGLPPDVVAALRTGFDAMVKDAAFIAEIDKLKVELDPYTGQQLQERAVKLLDVPDSVRRRAMAIFGRT